MKHLVLLTMLFSSVFAKADDYTTLYSLTQLTWKNRILLIYSDNHQELQAELASVKSALDERHVLWFIVDETRPVASKLTTNYAGDVVDNLTTALARQYTSLRSSVVLIGKDGGIKSRSPKLDLQAVFRQIDSMPMRIMEMKDQHQLH